MRQEETDFVEINLKKDGKKWFSGTPFISMYRQGGIENYVPTIYQSDSSSNPRLQQKAAHKLLSKSYRAVIQRFWTLCLLSASLPFLPFLSPSSTVILPSSGDSAPLWCLKNFLSRREHIISHGKKGKPFRKRDMELSPLLSHGFWLLVPAKECGKGAYLASHQRTILHPTQAIQCDFTVQAPHTSCFKLPRVHCSALVCFVDFIPGPGSC